MPFEFDRQKFFLKFLKAVSYIVNAAIVLAILAVVGWYIWGLVESANDGIHYTR